MLLVFWACLALYYHYDNDFCSMYFLINLPDKTDLLSLYYTISNDRKYALQLLRTHFESLLV